MVADISPLDWIKLSSVGMIALLGFCAKVRALQTTDPTVVSCIRAAEIVMAFALQVVAMGQSASVVEVSGSLLIMVSIICIARERHGEEKVMVHKF